MRPEDKLKEYMETPKIKSYNEIFKKEIELAFWEGYRFVMRM